MGKCKDGEDKWTPEKRGKMGIEYTLILTQALRLMLDYYNELVLMNRFTGLNQREPTPNLPISVLFSGYKKNAPFQTFAPN